MERNDEAARAIWRRAQRWQDWRGFFEPDAAEIRGPALRLVREAFRAAAGDFAINERLERAREILVRALHELEEMSHGS